MSITDSPFVKDDPCACPFCDEPICPDPADERYKCKGDKNLKIHLVDCVGLYCPVPVMTAKEEIDRLKKGELMELIADDPASAEDIPRWAKRAGHKFLAMRKLENDYHFLIQKENEEES
ncbi:MAG: sulfurtransferase TusA family protein [Firmicutes bacterium]|nr:sulfurtransferase TusA family protein [Bacillota bacterium]